MNFSAREVTVGSASKIKLAPHLGEFDEAALFTKRLEYENASFKLLEANVPNNYDLVIEFVLTRVTCTSHLGYDKNDLVGIPIHRYYPTRY